MKTSRFGCRSERSRLLAYLDGTLDLTRAEMFEKHLDECAACRAALEFDQLVEEVLHRDAGTDFDADFESRIAAGVSRAIDERTHSAPPSSNWSRWRVAAGIVVGVAATYGLWELTKGVDEPVTPTVPNVASSTPTASERTHPNSTESLPTVASSEHASPLPSPDPVLDPAEIERLTRARDRVREALRSAANSDDFATQFATHTKDLAAERWPIEAMVRGAIEDSDPEIAHAAIRGVKALSIAGALPAIRRAARRPELAGPALVALGDLGDVASLSRLSQALREPSLANFACSGLSKLGTREAADTLSRALDDPERFAAAFDALLAMGERGISELLVRADRGHIAVRDGLAHRGLPTNTLLETLLTSSSDENVISAAARAASTRGTGALQGLIVLLSAQAHHEVAIEALVTIGGRTTLDALLVAIQRRSIDVETARSGVLRVLAGMLDSESAALAIARSDAKAALLATLADPVTASPSEESLRCTTLRAIAGSAEIDLRTRLTAARYLAEVDGLDASVAFDLTGAAAVLGDADAIVSAILNASRGGITLSADEFDALSRPGISNLFEKAIRIGERWRASGQAPTEDDRTTLAEKLRRAR